MTSIYGQNKWNLVLLHEGTGPQAPSREGIAKAVKALKNIAANVMKLCLKEDSLVSVAGYCLNCLEEAPQFNVGIRGSLQSDGVPRLSASIMDGERQRFSGVISACYIPYPSKLAEQLQKTKARVLTNPGAELLAREKDLFKMGKSSQILSIPVMIT